MRQNQLSSSGVIFNGAPGATCTFQFNNSGLGVLPFAIGQTGWMNTGGQVVGGDDDPAYTNLTLYSEVERKTFCTHADFNFTEPAASKSALVAYHQRYLRVRNKAIYARPQLSVAVERLV